MTKITKAINFIDKKQPIVPLSIPDIPLGPSDPTQGVLKISNYFFYAYCNL